MNTMSNITVSHATEGTLADVCLDIPKRALTVFTGLSGSGKSTLLVDVLFNECQRQYLEAMGMEGIRKPRVERITGASPAVLVTQSDVNRNPRSTVGTATDIYTDLRMVFEKLHVRACPCCGEEICAANCQEETERDGDEFLVFMRCSLCGHRMRKITRTEFSFNTKEGACPVCEGIGKTLAIDWSRVLHEDRSVEDGAVDAWNHRYQAYQADALQRAFRHYGLPDAKSLPVAQFDSLQREILLQGTESPALSQALPNVEPPKTVAAGRFEGVEPLLMRRLAERRAPRATILRKRTSPPRNAPHAMESGWEQPAGRRISTACACRNWRARRSTNCNPGSQTWRARFLASIDRSSRTTCATSKRN